MPVSGTHYELSIELDAGRVPTFFINRQRWARGTTALSATVSGGYGPSRWALDPSSVASVLRPRLLSSASAKSCSAAPSPIFPVRRRGGSKPRDGDYAKVADKVFPVDLPFPIKGGRSGALEARHAARHVHRHAELRQQGPYSDQAGEASGPDPVAFITQVHGTGTDRILNLSGMSVGTSSGLAPIRSAFSRPDGTLASVGVSTTPVGAATVTNASMRRLPTARRTTSTSRHQRAMVLPPCSTAV